MYWLFWFSFWMANGLERVYLSSSHNIVLLQQFVLVCFVFVILSLLLLFAVLLDSFLHEREKKEKMVYDMVWWSLFPSFFSSQPKWFLCQQKKDVTTAFMLSFWLSLDQKSILNCTRFASERYTHFCTNDFMGVKRRLYFQQSLQDITLYTF